MAFGSVESLLRASERTPLWEGPRPWRSCGPLPASSG